MKRCLAVLMFFLAGVYPASAGVVVSPDGHTVLSFVLREHGAAQGCPSYSITYKGEPFVAGSGLGFELENGESLVSGFKIVSSSEGKVSEQWRPVYGERALVDDSYSWLTVRLVKEQSPSCEMELEFRCYDAGAAFRYRIIKYGASGNIGIKREKTEFRFLKDHVAWVVNSAQGKYSRKRISSMGSNVERPLTVESGSGVCAAVGEAALVDYARMKLERSPADELSVVSQLSGEVKSALPLTTPWRVVMLGDSPGELLENNDIFLNLNEPCAIRDTDWIKPGKVIREVTLTTDGGKACVDFAVKRNLQFVEYDAGWYGHEYDDNSDATTVTVDPKRSPGPLDLQEVVRYAAERNVGIILYVNRRALERQLDELLPLYQKWGIKGLKYGFVNVGTQQWTSWLHEAVRKAARYEMMVDVHDEYRPTGYSRTYPNLMTQEGIGGDETSPSNEQTLSILFTRMICGAGDNTICYYDGRVAKNATHAYQLAKAVCIYSPWQFLYWYDRPPASDTDKGGAGGQKGKIGDEPELEFFDHVPTVWDDTKVIHGRIGEYAVIARRSAEQWFVGGMNSGTERSLKVPLDFLEKGREYTAHIYHDDPVVETRTRVGIRRVAVDSSSVLEMAMGSQGGQAVRIVPSAK